MKQEPNWMSILRDAVESRSMQRVGVVIGYSKATISLVLSGKYPRSTKKIKARVLDRLKPRDVRPPQLKELDPIVHKRLKKLAAHFAERDCAELFGIDQSRVWPLIRGTDKLGAADVIEKLKTTPFSKDGNK